MKILVFESKRLSYESSRTFMEVIVAALRQLSVEVTVFELTDIQAQEEELEQLCGQHYDMIWDMNSVLPVARFDEQYYLDCFDAPFYNFIVDHPMHVHRSLAIPLADYHVVCLDQYHKEYIEKYYTHIKSVHCMPFAGMPAVIGDDTALEYGQRPFDICFPGTYTPLAYYEQQMDSVNEHYIGYAKEMLHIYRHGNKLPIDQLYMQVTGCDEEMYSMQMYKARYIDRYIREWYREHVIETILQSGLTIDVVGFRWQMYDTKYPKLVRIHPPCDYRKQLEYLSESKVVLNVQPLFLDAAHDRVCNALCNGAVSLTDDCTFTETQLQAGIEYLRYDPNNPEDAISDLKQYLQDNMDGLSSIARAGYQKVRNRHRVLDRVEALLEEIAF